MNCEYCVKSPTLGSGIVHASHRMYQGLRRALRSLLSVIAQLG